MKLKCANCGRQISDASYRNMDGDPCCQFCWEMEEETLNQQYYSVDPFM